MSFRIEKIFAFVSTDENDEEGVCAFWSHANNTWMPMVAADEKRLVQLIPLAKDLANSSGHPIRLIRMEQRVELQEFLPNETRANPTSKKIPS